MRVTDKIDHLVGVGACAERGLVSCGWTGEKIVATQELGEHEGQAKEGERKGEERREREREKWRGKH
jgi:hypothetical protein